MVILVHGSINIDQFFGVESIVAPGQTIHSSSSSQLAGGKGANTAVAIAKAGSLVDFAGTIGKDGSWLRTTLIDHGVRVHTLLVDENLPTGKAFIQVAKNGDNSIVLDAGANARIYDLPDLNSYSHPSCDVGEYSHVVCQNEIPYASTLKTLQAAKLHSATTIFNPSPMLTRAEIRSMDWACVDYLVLNEGEADVMLKVMEDQYRSENHADESQVPSTLDGIARFRQVGLNHATVIVTKGSEGADVLLGDEIIHFSLQLPIFVTDTTGAGDCFVGFFTALLSSADVSLDLKSKVSRAMQVALAAASISCESSGAMDSYRCLGEVKARMDINLRHKGEMKLGRT